MYCEIRAQRPGSFCGINKRTCSLIRYFRVFNLLKLLLPYVEDKEDIVMEVVAEEEELLEGVLGKGIDSPNY